MHKRICISCEDPGGPIWDEVMHVVPGATPNA